MDSSRFEKLLGEVRLIASDIAAKHADDVDRNARFPIEAVTALRGSKVLSAGVPEELGGGGCTMLQLANLCSALSRSCSSSGMILAMHLIQLACLARHGLESDFFRSYLSELVHEQYLIASVTSEVGTFGDTRSSICAVETEGECFRLKKEATTVSYGAYADALLVTARQSADASSSDQVLVLLKKGDYQLTQSSHWDTLGMRGTCSPGGILVGKAPVKQIVPGSYAVSSPQTMVPYAHILWASLWWGIAADAMSRASSIVRAQARKNPGVIPVGAADLAKAMAELEVMKNHWMSCAADFDSPRMTRDELTTMPWALKMNNLKIKASEAAPHIVHRALQIIGMRGYHNGTKFSIGRHYRDALSASLMISNERLIAQQSTMWLMVKDHL